MTLPPPSAGSVALVTGASSGIGEQFARQLVARGYRVVVTARREDRLQALCAELGGDEHAVAVGTDLAVPQERDRLAARIDELGAQVDVLVNNAGLGIYTKFGAEGRDQELQMLRVDVEAVADLMLRYLPGMVERRRGDIVFVSSDVAVRARPFMSSYAAGKWGLEGMAHAMQMELEGTGVRASIVRPGGTWSEMGSDWDPEAGADVLNHWVHFGFARHPHFLKPQAIGEAITTIVSAPRGVHLNLVEVTPEAPLEDR